MSRIKNNEGPAFLKVEQIRVPLPEAESILSALRGGEVDGVMVSIVGGERVFMLSGAELPYRIMIEAMSEGAVTITTDGTIPHERQSSASAYSRAKSAGWVYSV